MKTVMAKPETVKREWLLIDAAGLPIGRVASQVAYFLRGKHKTCFTPHVDTGDYVIVVNTDKMILTGKKLDQKIYFHYSGYPGGDGCGHRGGDRDLRRAGGQRHHSSAGHRREKSPAGTLQGHPYLLQCPAGSERAGTLVPHGESRQSPADASGRPL